MRKKKICYYSIFLSLVLLTIIFVISPRYEESIYDEYRRNVEQLPYSDLGGSCPNATSVVVSVLAGGRLGNQVWEYLSVWAVARNHPGWWPAVPRTILSALQPLFSPLAIPAIEDLAERCNASFLLEEMKNCTDRGTEDLFQATRHYKNRTLPFLYVLRRYAINVDATAIHWPELRFQLPVAPEMQKLSDESLHQIGNKIRTAQNLKHDEPLEFVGVHVRRTDYSSFIERIAVDAKAADHRFYLNAMEEMRRQLHPRHCAFVVVSDDLVWCREFLTGAPDVEIAGTGDTKNPYFDLALLSACNHSVFAYGTFSLTAAMQHPLGRTIVHAKGGSKVAGLRFAKMLKWTLV